MAKEVYEKLYVCTACGEEYMGKSRKWTCPICGEADTFEEAEGQYQDDYDEDDDY